MIGKIGELISKIIIERAAKKFEDLENALDHLYWWEKNFSIEKDEDKIVSQGVCPIYEKYPDWCDEGCLKFAENLAEEYEYSVERTKRKPEDEFCRFEFKKE